MKVSDFLNLKDHRKKIMIVSDLARGQALLRLHERKTGTPVLCDREDVCVDPGSVRAELMDLYR